MTNKEFTVTNAEEFTTMPWRNGMGTTIELLKHCTPGDEQFAYRLSMATVNEDGPFSNFDGYDRTLVLLKGAGISLKHDSEASAVLERPLQMASFDGGDATTAILHDGPIVDFNIMARSDSYRAKTTCNADSTLLTLESGADCAAVYAIGAGLEVLLDDNSALKIPQGVLLHSTHPLRNRLTIQGAACIAVELYQVGVL